MLTGQLISVNACKANGVCYRSWKATIEAVSTDCITTITQPGHIITGPDKSWASIFAARTYYWYQKPYSLLEVYQPDKTLHMIYVNINSLVQVEEARLWYVDYELDVVFQPPEPAFIVDEDEFAAAALEYGYSKEHKRYCYQAANEALALSARWQVKGMPVFVTGC